MELNFTIYTLCFGVVCDDGKREILTGKPGKTYRSTYLCGIKTPTKIHVPRLNFYLKIRWTPPRLGVWIDYREGGGSCKMRVKQFIAF